MPDIPGGYAPPGVYTRTNFDNPIQSGQVATTLPVLIGTGNEILSETNLGLIRGSSSTVDQRVVDEDETGRAVVSEGPIVLGAFNGALTKLQVKNYPLVTGDGTGTTATDTNSVAVTINGTPTVVLGLDGANGVIELAVAPKASDVVRVTYFFNRTDTLTTDDVSNQVTAENAILRGAVGEPVGGFLLNADTLLLTVNGGAEQTVTFGVGAFTAAQVVSSINAQTTGVTASVFVNNFGEDAVALTVTQSLVIGDGSANGALGFNQGQSTSRNATFKVFNTPIVDGTNGGITTTDPSNVTVKVNNVQVIPTAVDGATGSVTLPLAPAPGSTVTVQYYFNTWQDTFDYLAHIGVTQISQVGLAPGRTDFLDGVSWILKDDVIVWGTASLVSAGNTSTGSTPFGGTQVSTTLVDNRMYLAETSSVIDTSVFPAVESRTQFVLPEQPTTGNGRNNPLGTAFDSVANGRFDLPTYNPNLVSASVGFDLADAVNRGTVEVTAVDPTTNTITLANPVVEGEKVFATFYYSTMVDETYTLACQVDGVSGVGSYSLTNSNGSNIFAASFGSKSAGLATIPVEFPSGSEVFPDALLATPSDTSSFTGPVAELVTVEFAATDETPAKYTAPGIAPFYFEDTGSNQLDFNVDASPNPGPIPLNAFGNFRRGCFAVLTGGEVAYDPDSGSTTYSIQTGVNDTVLLNVDGQEVSATVFPPVPAGTLTDYVNAINTAAFAVLPQLVGATAFTNGFEVFAGEYDQMTVSYTGDVSGLTPAPIILTPGVYATATDLAAEVDTQLAAAFTDARVTCTANASGQLVLTLDATVAAAGDTEAFIEIVGTGGTTDFDIVAGFTQSIGPDQNSTKLYHGDIAKRFTVPAASGRLNHDRILLRNRIWTGASDIVRGQTHHHDLGQCRLEITGGTGLVNCGLVDGDTGEATYGATMKGANLFGRVGWSEGQVPNLDPGAGQPLITFYDGTDPVSGAQNNTLTVRLGSTVSTTTFTSVPTGTATPLFEAAGSGVVQQLNTQFTLDFPLGAVTAHQEGAAIRIVVNDAHSQSVLEITGDGTANTRLGFPANGTSASRSLVSAQQVVSALSNHDPAGTAFNALVFGFTPVANSFSALALAKALKDDAGNFSVFVQSQTLGTSSQILVVDSNGLRAGTNFLAQAGDSAIGENAAVGYFVTSSNPAGSGSANNSKFNSGLTGLGQDGEIGQTYTDLVTGLRFTVLPRAGGAAYPTGESFTLNVGNTVTTNSNIPVLLPGVELLVSNTLGVAVGDTATVETFDKSGDEPSIGQVYYASYTYTKQDYSTQIFSKLSDVEAAFGPVSPNNPLSLGAYLMFINGAVQIGIKQVQKDAGSNSASESSFIAAIDSLEGNLPGNVIPGLLVPLTPATSTLLNYLAIHCDVQSSIRYKSERTAILGFAAGTQPDQAGLLAKATKSSRVRVVYPDIATVPITDALGNTTDYLVDGRYMAAAMAANRVTPSRDVASPWTGAQLVGFSSLGRSLDAVEANQVAVNGVTVLEDRAPFLRVRQGLTTDMTNVLTKTPTVIQIADLVQQSSRAALEPYIGTKLIGSVTGSIETDLTRVFKRLKNSQIVANYTGITVTIDPNDPTSINVEAFYQPVFPLLYIVLTFNVRTSL